MKCLSSTWPGFDLARPADQPGRAVAVEVAVALGERLADAVVAEEHDQRVVLQARFLQRAKHFADASSQRWARRVVLRPSPAARPEDREETRGTVTSSGAIRAARRRETCLAPSFADAGPASSPLSRPRPGAMRVLRVGIRKNGLFCDFAFSKNAFACWYRTFSDRGPAQLRGLHDRVPHNPRQRRHVRDLGEDAVHGSRPRGAARRAWGRPR